MNGLVLIDKPAGCTSHDVVNCWRKLTGTKRVGHLGTLDPMATGLLALLTGPVTRLAPFYGKEDKTYQAEILFGLTSDTYDVEGTVIPTHRPIPDRPAVTAALEAFRGRFLQTPPPVSAKKIAGVPAYKLARKNIAVELRPAEVHIKDLSPGRFFGDCLELEITCSAGTYIRRLAHDLGESLGCGALLSRLRRTRAGGFSVENARTLDDLRALAAHKNLAAAVIPAACLLPDIPSERVNGTVEAQIRQGRQFHTSPFVVPAGSSLVRALSQAGELIAIAKLIIPNLYQPTTVFPPESEA